MLRFFIELLLSFVFIAEVSQPAVNGQGVPILTPNLVPGGSNQLPMVTTALENKLFDVSKIKPPRVQVMTGSNILDIVSPISGPLDGNVRDTVSLDSGRSSIDMSPTVVLSSLENKSRIRIQPFSNTLPSQGSRNVINLDTTGSGLGAVNGLPKTPKFPDPVQNIDTSPNVQPINVASIQRVDSGVKNTEPFATDLNILFDSTKLSKANNPASVIVVSPTDNPAITVDGAGFTAQGSFDVMQTGGPVKVGSLPPSKINIDMQFMPNDTSPIGSEITSIQTDGSFLGYPSGGDNRLLKVSQSADNKFHDQASLLSMISQQISDRQEPLPPIFPTITEPKFASDRMPFTGPASAWDRKPTLPRQVDLYIPLPTMPSLPVGPRVEIGTPPPPPVQISRRPVVSNVAVKTVMETGTNLNKPSTGFAGPDLSIFNVPVPDTRATEKKAVQDNRPVYKPVTELPPIFPVQTNIQAVPTPSPTIEIIAISNLQSTVRTTPPPPLTTAGPATNTARTQTSPNNQGGITNTVNIQTLPNSQDGMINNAGIQTWQNIAGGTINSVRVQTLSNIPETTTPSASVPSSSPASVGHTGHTDSVQYDMSPFLANGNWAIFDPTSLPPDVNFTDLGPVIDIAIDPNEINFTSGQDISFSNMFGHSVANSATKKPATNKTVADSKSGGVKDSSKRQARKDGRKSKRRNKKRNKKSRQVSKKTERGFRRSVDVSTTVNPIATDTSIYTSPNDQVRLSDSMFTSPNDQVRLSDSMFTSPNNQVRLSDSMFTSPIDQVRLSDSMFTSPNDQVRLSQMISAAQDPSLRSGTGLQQISDPGFGQLNQVSVDLPPPPPF